MADDFSGQAAEVDLFGLPVRPIRDRRGRPSFRKDKDNQDFVSVRVAAGWTQKAIADDMGIDEKTLRKHFSRELEGGRLFVEGLVLDVLLKQVREGRAASIRQLREVLADAGPQAPRSRGKMQTEDDEDDAAKAVPLGKKEQRLQDAQDVPADYGDIFEKMDRRH
ncbi:hypothetical protein [Ancylobacter pratisalsi]|uniref:Uncharacterized protein n=1 Tax=Ancylobacter pratisalsi TaxID=1745854 RepID=A0A6P1YLK8_9HYPH|nr:hypothetical protein [Ancylobacter pratisalsi]QIB32644.1 hypothetical protein G3A50_02195 [Ancylobacter pratisalsi]